MNGKGDKRRPQTVTDKHFNDNWDRIFGKKEDKKESKKKTETKAN